MHPIGNSLYRPISNQRSRLEYRTHSCISNLSQRFVFRLLSFILFTVDHALPLVHSTLNPTHGFSSLVLICFSLLHYASAIIRFPVQKWLVDNLAWCYGILKYLIFMLIHILIPIQTKDNQTLSDNNIALTWWLQGTNSKNCLKIYKK
jgi:hypothetical protein